MWHMNRKGVTPVVIVLTIFTFYTGLVVFLGLMGSDSQPSSTIETPEEPSFGTAISAVSFFFKAIGFTISGLPAWFTTLLFLPLGITMLYIVIELFIPG